MMQSRLYKLDVRCSEVTQGGRGLTPAFYNLEIYVEAWSLRDCTNYHGVYFTSMRKTMSVQEILSAQLVDTPFIKEEKTK